MRKLGIAAVMAAALVGATATSAGAAVDAPQGPCERQRALFDKYNIELGMHSPELAYVYTTACSITG